MTGNTGDFPDLDNADLVELAEMLDFTADYLHRPIEHYTVDELSNDLRRWAARLLPDTDRPAADTEQGHPD